MGNRNRRISNGPMSLKRELILGSIGAALACSFMYGALWVAVWLASLLNT